MVDPAPSVVPFLELLNRQLSLQLESATVFDAENSSLGSLTASRRNTKPFIIGFIPPDNPINFVPIQAIKNKLTDIQTRSGPSSIDASGELANVDGLAKKSPEFHAKVVQVANNLGLDPSHLAAVMAFETGRTFDPSIKNKQSGATGLIQFTKGAAEQLNTTREELAQMTDIEQMDYVEAYFKQTGKLGLVGKNGDPLGDTYLCVLAPNFVGRPPDTPVYSAPTKAYEQNKKLDSDGDKVINVAEATGPVKGIFNRAQRRHPISVGGQDSFTRPPEEAVSNARGIMTPYSLSANDPLANEWGRSIELADAERQRIAARQVQALQEQVRIIQDTPPLILLINPSTFNRRYEHAKDTGIKGRYGQIVHTWLERPLRIESNGVTAGQYVAASDGSGGLSNEMRIHSLSYANLFSLLLMYKNNGRIYAGSESDPGIPILAFTIYIYYDHHIYLGSFDSFDIDDKGDKPYNMSYEFSFTARYDRSLTLPISDYLLSASQPF